jgi:hypothetical protein
MQPGVVVTLVTDILMFPVWWYSRGLLLMLRGAQETFVGYVKYFSIDVWIKNLFVPMFGQRDWQSRLISIFMRLVQIVGRSFGLFVVAGLILGVVGVYLVAPIALGVLAAYHLLGSLVYA